MTKRITPGGTRTRQGAGVPPMLRRAALALAVTALALPRPASLDAQAVTVPRQEECRCVDRDGNEIENCTCMRMPRMEVVAPMLAGMMERRARIGVYIDYDQDDEVEARGGVLLTEVMEDGPAHQAGLRAGDTVLRVNGHALTEPLDDDEAEEGLNLDQSVPVQRFVWMVGRLDPDEPAEFVVLRDGERRTFTVTPEAARSAFAFRMGEGPTVFMRGEGLQFDAPEPLDMKRRELEWRERMRAPEVGVWRFEGPEENRVFRLRQDSLGNQSGFAFFGGDPCLTLTAPGRGGLSVLAGAGPCIDGVEFLELNPDLAEYFDAEEGGVLVTEVAEESTLGLRAGDVLLAIDGREVRDPDHARRILSSYEMDEEIRLRVQRQGREIEVLGRRRDG